MSETASWQPSASIAKLLKRAAIMTEIRRFFADRGVLEVETPCHEPGDGNRYSSVPVRDPLCRAWPLAGHERCT